MQIRKEIKAYFIRNIKPKFYKLYREKSKPRYVLDIGIANHSYRECKLIFPDSIYHGLDFVDSDVDFDFEDKFILNDLEKPRSLEDLCPIYDIIIANHVLEHLERGIEVFSELCRILAPGGLLYVEIPSIRTAQRFKSFGRYHFNDDPTHKSFYRMEDLGNIAMRSDCKVLSCGPCSTWLKDALSLPRAMSGILRGDDWGSYMIHFQRKIDHMLVQRST